MTTPSFSIRPCVESDAETLVNLVRELAVYEKLEAHAKATPQLFREHLFGPEKSAEAIVAEVGDDVIGFALYFKTFSTFRGQSGIYLEDLFVKPDHRGLGVGKALLAGVAKRVLARNGGRLEWAVLNWNAPAIGFYRSVGARPQDEWTVYRVDDEALRRLAGLAPDPEERNPG